MSLAECILRIRVASKVTGVQGILVRHTCMKWNAVYVCVCTQSLEELTVAAVADKNLCSPEDLAAVLPTCPWKVLNVMAGCFDLNQCSWLPRPAAGGKLSIDAAPAVVRATLPGREQVSCYAGDWLHKRACGVAPQPCCNLCCRLSMQDGRCLCLDAVSGVWLAPLLAFVTLFSSAVANAGSGTLRHQGV